VLREDQDPYSVGASEREKPLTRQSRCLREDEPYNHNLDHDDGDKHIVICITEVVEADWITAHVDTSSA
jgi:hypothetical protein